MTTTLLSLDPGGTTGAAYFQIGDDAPLALANAEQWPGGLSSVLDHLGDIMDVEILISESFVLDGRTPHPDVTPLRIEGALTTLRHLEGRTPPIFQRNYAKKHAPDALLKKHGLWQKGMPHANDAIRHAIAFAKTQGHRPTIKRLWPVPEELR